MSLTKAQLEALVDDIYKSNGIGAITGPVPNYLMKQIIAAIFDNLVGGDSVTPDNRSIKLNANHQLEVYLPEWLSLDPSSQAAAVLKFNRTGGMRGLYVMVDGRTIFGNNGILTTASGGGTNPNISIESYEFSDSAFSTAVETRNAFLSESGSNGYLKLATGEAVDDCYINSKTVVTMDDNPVLTVKIKLESVTDTVAKIYLSELTNGRPSGAGIMLVYDSDVDEYWHLVVTDGGVNTVYLATLTAADTNEHLFDIRVKDGGIAWLIDDVVIGSDDTIDLADTELNFGVNVASTTADGTSAVLDTLTRISVRVEETGVEFSVTPVHEKIADIIHGYLYNYFVIDDVRELTSSDDWAVPTVDDLIALLANVEPESTEFSNTIGGKLKEVTEDILKIWQSPNTGATNELGFNGRGSGNRSDAGAYGMMALMQVIAYKGVYETDVRVGFKLVYNSEAADFYWSGSKKTGTSIRLLKATTLLNHGESGTYTGNDGKVYRTICIHGQEWLTDNLAETQYRNNDEIAEVTDNSAWAALSTGARCILYNDQQYF